MLKPVILIVDDERPYVDLLGELLEKYGLEAHTAYDAGDALFRMRATVPDVILMDLKMPQMDGLLLIDRLRSERKWRKIPIVVVSARTAKEDQEAALEAGANRFLTKPFSSAELIEVLTEFVATTA
ncbi:MAG: response regulator [Chloroflexi bacterium]|nr:response regulator [Chloroflexota bacterium]